MILSSALKKLHGVKLEKKKPTSKYKYILISASSELQPKYTDGYPNIIFHGREVRMERDNGFNSLEFKFFTVANFTNYGTRWTHLSWDFIRGQANEDPEA